ncbi:putative transposase [Methylobacterium sp. yr668]|nr:putative transposase [Methylobacterium sp. yr668]
MRFRLIGAAKKHLPVARLCKVLAVSPSGYLAWKIVQPRLCSARISCCRADVRSAFTLSHETHSSPRMTHELREQGVAAGRRRVARQPRRFRRNTYSGHTFPVAPNLRISTEAGQRSDSMSATIPR